MPPRKILKEVGAIQADNDTMLLPVENVPEIKENKLVAKVKREMTPAQKINMAKMIEANKTRFENIRKAKEDAAEAAEKARKEDIDAKLKAGTHVRVKIIPKTKRVKKEAVAVSQSQTATSLGEPVAESEESSVEFQASSKPVKVKKTRPPTPSETETETAEDTETDGESYKQGKRNVRREVKKNIKALKEIDNVISSNNGNPYLSYLTGRWK
jgi:hypothetical protein